MLYTKRITDIEWNDVVDFCNQRIQEGATLDYKKDFPNNLQKTIASFANTMGGIILIGVDEDNENKPILPVDGIIFERGISEKIMNLPKGMCFIPWAWSNKMESVQPKS